MSQARKPPVQKRARQNRQKLVDALGQLLREKAFEDISMSELAKTAGLGVGTVYRRFENREALIPVIFELYEDRLTAFTASKGRLELSPAATLFDTLKAVLSTAYDFLKSEGYLLQAVYLYARQRPELVGEQWERFAEAGIESARQIIDVYAEDIMVEDKEQAARMMTYLFNTLPVERALYPDIGVAWVLDMSDEAFVDSMARAVFGYLTSKA